MPLSPQMAENQAQVRSLYAAYAAGDRMAFNDLLADDVHWHSVGPAELPWAGLRQGRDAVHEYFRILERESAIEGYVPDHALCDGDWLILLGTLRVRLHGDEMAVDYPKVDAIRFRDGKIVEFREYYDTATAQARYRAARR